MNDHMIQPESLEGQLISNRLPDVPLKHIGLIPAYEYLKQVESHQFCCYTQRSING